MDLVWSMLLLLTSSSFYRQSNKEKEDKETWKQAIPGCPKCTDEFSSISPKTSKKTLRMVLKIS